MQKCNRLFIPECKPSLWISVLTLTEVPNDRKIEHRILQRGSSHRQNPMSPPKPHTYSAFPEPRPPCVAATRGNAQVRGPGDICFLMPESSYVSRNITGLRVKYQLSQQAMVTETDECGPANRKVWSPSRLLVRKLH